MNLKEFKQMILTIPNDYDDYIVVVKTSEAVLGPIPSSVVKDVGIGFDWDINKIIINTNDELLKKKGLKKCNIK